MDDDTADPRWLSLAEAVNRVVDSSLLDIFGAADLIERGLISGKMRTRARARRQIQGHADHISASHAATANNIPLIKIDELFWRNAVGFSVNVHEELLLDSPVSIVMAQPPHFEIEGLQINASSLRQWFLRHGGVAVSPSLRGRPPKEQAWTFLIARLIEMTRVDGLHEANYPNESALLTAIRDAWGDMEFADRGNSLLDNQPDVLDDRSIRGVLKAVWSEMVRGY